MTPFPTQEPDAGATNMPNPNMDATGCGNDDSGELRAEVARALGYAGVSPFEIEDFRIEDVADRLYRAGFRRVAVDDATVDRVARALAENMGYQWDGDPTDATVAHANEAWFMKRAAAAIRALRGDSQPTPNSFQTGRSCVRCGVWDAVGVDGHQLCGECDTALDAEVEVAALREETQ